MLWMEGRTQRGWATFNQIRKAGGMVQKGQKGTKVYFWKKIQITVEDEVTGEEKKKMIPMMKEFTVFNLEQCDGMEKFLEVFEKVEPASRDQRGERFMERTGADIRIGGTLAAYDKVEDLILLPERESFHEMGGFYSTAIHEVMHWTGHEDRKGRDLSGSFGSPDYAFEELVAEIGSAFGCADLGIEGGLQHPEYIGHWIKVLEDDSHAITRAASLARQGHEFLVELVGDLDQESSDQEAA